MIRGAFTRDYKSRNVLSFELNQMPRPRVSREVVATVGIVSVLWCTIHVEEALAIEGSLARQREPSAVFRAISCDDTFLDRSLELGLSVSLHCLTERISPEHFTIGMFGVPCFGDCLCKETTTHKSASAMKSNDIANVERKEMNSRWKRYIARV